MTLETPFPHGPTDALAAQVMDEWRQQSGDLWVFGYGSLIWRPDLPYSESRRARVHGWHRALQMWSHVNRGTPDNPGLVFALLSGGSCQGMVFRVPRAKVGEVFPRLWQREMPLPVYDPRWLRCQTATGDVLALAFTLSRRSPNYTGRIDDHQMLHILRQAQGRYGTTLDYLVRTAEALRLHRMCDRESERLLALARRAGLA